MNTAPNARNSGNASHPQPVERDEYLLDEAVEETFPASDPPSETQPGSIVAERYAASERADAPAGPEIRAARSLGWLPLAALAAGAAVALLALRRRS